MKGRFVGVARLSMFIIRQDRLRYVWWLMGIIVLTLIVPPALNELYPTQQDRDVLAETMENPVMETMVGPGDLANYTLGAMVSHQMLLMTAIAVAVMNILLMVRHTRAEEEEGQVELLRSFPVARDSQLTASMLTLTGVNLLLALLIGVGLSSLSFDSMGVTGSFIYGAALGVIGMFFASITAVCSQLAGSSRGAVGLSFTVMIACYLLRSGTEWIPPFGWLTQVQPYSENNWLPVGGLLVAGAVLFLFAVMLLGKRDIGSGLIPSRNGRAHASVLLRSPIGLAWRLQRTTFLSWSIGMLVLGVSYGSVLGDLDAFFQDNDMLASMIVADENSSLTAQFLPMLMAVLAFISTIPALLSIHKVVGEERKSRVDILLSRSVSRTALFMSYLVLACITAVMMLSFAALGLWLAGTTSMEEPFSFQTVWQAALVHFPAIAVLIGVSSCLIGIAKKAVGLVWLYLFYGFMTLYLGGLFQFPEWMEKLSPFGFVSKLPIEDMNWLYAGGLIVMAILLMIIGINRYTNRDIEG
ncbi:ABC transporter permease [Sporosarcina sp. P17b]|uniref:ABC transporter permease n=1 Tax=Sporosarcina sp. P17b TaxID=2048260 RepID=UPI000C16650A|nr:ABC transporter permease [Sporosarcina sp. P17b]PIC73635.1 ABC transporter permease [Sporosarcina sp. P17b]